jgi:hypothetical protein
MQQYASELLTHVFHRLCFCKEDATHHREHRELNQTREIWPDAQRAVVIRYLEEGRAWLDRLELTETKAQYEFLIQQIKSCSPQTAITISQVVWNTVELDLNKRNFFVVPKDRHYDYNFETWAGEDFKRNFPKANIELKEAGNCLLFDLYTASVCQTMRALEYGLKSLQNNLGIKPPTGAKGSWGKIIERIQEEKGWPSVSGRPAKPSSPAWQKNHAFYDTAVTFLISVKDSHRNKVFHTASVYDIHSATDIFKATCAFLREVGKHLNE